MRSSNNFYDYELIDASDGMKLERWKDIILIRPDPQVIWKNHRSSSLWKEAHGIYHRSDKGGGYWETYKKIPAVWNVEYGNLTFHLKPMGFKHTGLFPEQAVNWDFVSSIIKSSSREMRVLNLFGYTGAATVSALKAGASVTHVDASKGMVQWAKENAFACCVENCPVRWLVDDCIKFVNREIRRGNRYDIIIMDPPSYGRGPNGEVWKLEDMFDDFIRLVAQLLDDNSLCLLVNSYTAGVSPTILNFIVSKHIGEKLGGRVFTDEIGLNITEKKAYLPCGNTTIWLKNG